MLSLWVGPQGCSHQHCRGEPAPPSFQPNALRVQAVGWSSCYALDWLSGFFFLLRNGDGGSDEARHVKCWHGVDSK